MSRESQVAALLSADALLATLAIGGIYTYEVIGVEGLRRGEDSPSEAAFDDEGYLQPCIVVKERGLVPTGDLQDLAERVVSTTQVVELYIYQRRGQSDIDLIRQRTFELLEGVRLTSPSSYQVFWDFETGMFPEMGPVKNTSVLRQDWRVISIRKPVNV